MACAACKARGKTWNGDDPVCGFHPDSSFNPDNWNCATLNALRDISRESASYAGGVMGQRFGDSSVGVFCIPEDMEHGGTVLVLTWYKNRGRTNRAWVIGYCAPSSATLELCEAIIDYYTPTEER